MQPDDEAYIGEEFDEFDDAPEPPRGVRFGEGQQINRRGRPRGSPNNAAIVKRIANKRHRVNINGVIRRKNTIELVILALRNKAASGDLQALKLIDHLTDEFQPQHSSIIAVLFVSKKLTGEEWQDFYNDSLDADIFESRYPYLIAAHRAHRRYILEIEKQCKAAENANHPPFD